MIIMVQKSDWVYLRANSCDFGFISLQSMALHYVPFYVTPVFLLISGHTQARPALPQFPFGQLTPTTTQPGCDIFGDRFYHPGEVIYEDRDSCYGVICTEHGIQIWDGDCQFSTTTPELPSSTPATFELETPTTKPPPSFPEVPVTWPSYSP